MKAQKLTIWDFDGVICDSLIECVTVTRVAASLIEQPGLEVSEKNLHEICRPDEIMELYGRMRVLRPFIVKGQDYLWQFFHLDLFRTCPANFKQYSEVLDTVFDIARDKTFEKAFYESRKLIQTIMKQQYFTLFKLYPSVLYAFRAALLRNRVYVCTARDQQAVNLILAEHAIDFPRDKIFSKDFNGAAENDGQGKSRQILDILDREGGREQNFMIIEDQVKAPADLRDVCSNMEVIHAAYGYGLACDWRSARLPCVKEVKKPEDLVYSIY